MKVTRNFNLRAVLNTLTMRTDNSTKQARAIDRAVLYVCKHSPYTLYDVHMEWKRVASNDGTPIGQDNYFRGIAITKAERAKIDGMIVKYLKHCGFRDIKLIVGDYDVKVSATVEG